MKDDSIKFTPETYLMSIFSFFSISKEKANKIENFNKITGSFKENAIFIIKGRLNQSSHASELNIKCFQKHVILFKEKNK